ncbi:hypothetical protein Nepgr_009490 [Nepenthes gracilis]|uniref:Uncharacterized protein n=1 Tax=Nepenthes gracilis TaxID=150966 RepID=A0AAD3XKE2_NEPGR|nr:hypothetical protein Nepgr_009490 [Nepenthes gracilis]
MSTVGARCTANSIVYNKTLCACTPGYLFNGSTSSCTLFTVSPSEWVVNSGVDYSIAFPETIFSFNRIKKFTQSQAIFLEVTAIMLLSWLLFCGLLRFGKLGDGNTPWFKIRWWISRLDVCFATRHWVDDQNVVVKRKTELGGAFSMASLMLFIGLLSALLYQIIAKRSVEVHNVRATNAPDLASFINDLEFNITTISSMSCSQLRGLGTLAMGNPGSIDYRVVSLSTFANYTCLNTSRGPTIALRCNNCPLTRDNIFITWWFADLPNEPALAVGFQFNLTAKNRAYKKHLSLVSGTVKNGSDQEDIPVTFRGVDTNILKFNLFPRLYLNLHGLKLVQPLFHEFLPGSFITNATELQSSLQSSTDGFVNTTLQINFLSNYLVEINNENIFGPVSFLANIGGLYCISLGIFFYFLVQCESRIKRLRNEDQVFQNIRRRRRAMDRWDKLRKYVLYTWGCNALQEDYDTTRNKSCCTCNMVDSLRKQRSLRKKMQQESGLSTISFGEKICPPNETVCSVVKEPSGAVKGEHLIKSCVRSASTLPVSMAQDNGIPPLPPLAEFKSGSSMDMSDIRKNIQDLYEYNAMLREKLVAAQSTLDGLTTRMAAEGQT